MSLSGDLISQFVKITNDKKEEKKETTVYGTIVEYSGSKYIKLDGSDLLTPVSTTVTTKPNERVTALIKNHEVIVTGNLTSPAARSGDVDDMGDTITELDILIAKKADVSALNAEQARIDSLVSENVIIKERLTASEAEIGTIKADKVDVAEKLTAFEAAITKLKADKLDASIADITYATIAELEAVHADINTLIFGSASGTTIHTSFANAVIAQLGDAQIKSAMIESISAGKITSGDIITNNVRVKSEDGNLTISDETMQISDGTRVRVQIGKDASNDYSINIWDAEGRLMFSKGGITDSAIKQAIIRNDMVSETANISASKLNIDSLFTEINNSSKTIKSAKVYLDDKKQTLDVAFTEMSSEVGELGETVSSQGTAISLIQGQLQSKIWQQDIDNATGGMSTQYSTLKQTVDGLSTTVAGHTTAIAGKADNGTVTAVSNKVSSIEQNLDGISTTVLEVQTDLNTLEVGGRNYLLNSEPEQYTNTATKGEFLKTTFDLAPIFDEHGLIEYTVSFEGYSETPGSVQVYSQNGSGSRYSFSKHVDMTTEWARYSVTFTPTGPDENHVESYLAFYGMYNTGVIPHVRKVKLEKGNRATDWTAAPEDTQSDIDALAERVATAETRIEQTSQALTLTATKTEVNTAKSEAISAASSDATSKANDALSKANANTSTLLKDYSTTTAMNAAIELKADSITNTVSSTYATKTALSTLQQTADDLTLRLDSIHIGGENLLNDSERERATNRFLEIVTKDALQAHIGREIVVSFDMKLGEGGVSRVIQLYPYQNNGVSIKDTVTFTPTTEWQRFSFKTTVKDWGINNAAYTTGGIAWYDYAGANHYMVRRVKIELGNMASDWSPSIADVANGITNAGKTATNYLNFSSSGLVVGDHTAGTLGKNVLIDSEAVKVRTGTTVNAIFGADIIELAKSNESATISMLNGAFKIYYDTTIEDGGFGIYGRTTDGQMRLAFQPVNENNNLTIGWGGYAARANSTNLYGHKMYLTTNEDIILNPGSGNVQLDGNVVLTNGKNLFGKRTDGVMRSMAIFNASDQMLFGYGSYSNNEGSVFYDGNNITMRSKNDITFQTVHESIVLQDGDGNATYSAFFRPASNAKCTLGTNANRWYAVYASNATIQTSDIREKENIISLSDTHSSLFDRLRPVQYNFINGNGRICYGLIAQDVIAAMADLGIGEHDLDLVHHDPGTDETEDTFGLAYSNLIALLIHEVQKLKHEITIIKGEIQNGRETH